MTDALDWRNLILFALAFVFAWATAAARVRRYRP
jgi:hypothetical protein